ncbi:hypothetical protein AAVH_12791 [Aphelenchoides avenae]|nr:hypothetical protein AAVH_12791 [Aphelenchus avenae]
MKRRASQRVSVSKSNSPKENRSRALHRLRSIRSSSVPPVSQRDDDDERCEKCQFAKKQASD